MSDGGALDQHDEWALAERIADLEAQVARLQRYGNDWEDDFREQFEGWQDEFVESTIQQMRDGSLHPGDLDPVKGGE